MNLESSRRVRCSHHGDLDALMAKPRHTPCPLTFNKGSSFELEAQLDEELDGGIERFHHDADVVHALESHVRGSTRRAPLAKGAGRCHCLVGQPNNLPMARPTNSHDRRAQIADALIAVMAKQGYDGASVNDIARKAGLAPGLVHYHFDNKLEILVEVVRTIAARHDYVLDETLGRVRGTEVRELVVFIEVHLGIGAHADPELLACWVLVIAEALREKSVRAEVETVLANLTWRVTDILNRGNLTGVFHCSDVPGTAAALIAIIQGYFAVAATARDVIPSGSAARSTLRMMEALVGTKLPRTKGSR
jgi:TetR/AcrR family transcriptional repressor of bet genes